jgi:hypothetical protein
VLDGTEQSTLRLDDRHAEADCLGRDWRLEKANLTDWLRSSA